MQFEFDPGESERNLLRCAQYLQHRHRGAQFTSEAFTTALKAHGVCISIDDKGRWLDNVYVERLWRSLKQEEIYRRAYEP